MSVPLYFRIATRKNEIGPRDGKTQQPDASAKHAQNASFFLAATSRDGIAAGVP
jgi:hypothetical protein